MSCFIYIYIYIYIYNISIKEDKYYLIEAEKQLSCKKTYEEASIDKALLSLKLFIILSKKFEKQETFQVIF